MRFSAAFLPVSIAAALATLSLTATVQPASANYTNPKLEKAADSFREKLQKRFGKKNRQARAARAFKTGEYEFKQRNWKRALRSFRRAAGYGQNTHRFWILYSYSLGAIRPPQYKNALITSIQAMRTAQTSSQRSQALYYLGFWHERLKQNDLAIDAYQQSVSLKSSSRVRRALTKLIRAHRHQVMTTSTVHDTETPQICLKFSRPLDGSDLSLYQRYISLQPAVKAGFTVNNEQLCIEGVAHGRTYVVTVREGLGDKAGELTTTETKRFTIAVPDRTSSVGFRGKAYILPKTGRQGVPLTSINVKEAKLQLYRINDRNLVNEINNKRIRELFSQYDTRKIRRESGELVWKGKISLQYKNNKQLTTAIRFSELVKNPKPGIYILMARDATAKADRWENWATQWIVVSDLGLTTFKGRDGLSVFVRSFWSAMPTKGVKLKLIARNNTVLGEATTDAGGRATFAPGLLRGAGGNEAAAVMAYGKGDFTFLDILRPAFDLTDRGVGGRAAPGPIDAYLYTERGVYRPGEKVHVTALLRNDSAFAISGMPLTLKLFRPDNVQARQFTLKADQAKGGGYSITIPTTKSSRTGAWTLQAYVDPKGKPVGWVKFQVEDFVPERLELKLSSRAPTLKPGVSGAVIVDGRFLYGAPAAKLDVKGEIQLKQDMRPYPGYKGYIFGLVQETWRSKSKELTAVKTDDKGAASLRIALDGTPETSRPLKAVVRVSLIEQGGRAVERTISIPVRWAKLTLGIKLDNDGESVAVGQPANFKVVGLDIDGKRRAAGGLTYVLYRVTSRYYWFYNNGRWNYKVIHRDTAVKKGDLDISDKAPGTLSFNESQGRYRLEVRDKETGAASSYQYYVGWYTSPSEGETPDKLTVRLDKKSYKSGETAKLYIKAPFDGVAHIVVGSSRVIVSRYVQVKKAGTTIDIDVKQKWGAGVYVVAAAYRPIDEQKAERKQRGPARALGVAYLSSDFSKRTLNVSMEAPKVVRPRGPVSIKVKVDGAAGRKVFLTVAAVDEGILSLTGYKSPDPTAHYYGKRTLSLELRDDYGRLIDAYLGPLGKIRTGGDAAGRHLGGLDASSIKTVSLYSGIVAVDSDGNATVPLNIPDFNGRLRLMASAWTDQGLGKAEGQLIVRDPVVSIVTLPRFLAPGDRGQATIRLDNVDGAAGNYKLELKSTGIAASFAKPSVLAVTLAKATGKTATFTLVGNTTGVSTLTMILTGPGGLKLERSWDIAVRPAQAVVSRQLLSQLKPGEDKVYAASLVSDYLPGTAKVVLSFSNSSTLGVPALVRSLASYPYGCAEQTTSKALPLLYVSDVARSVGIAKDDTKLRARVQSAIYRVLSMQLSDGSFGLWSARDTAEGWLTAYVMDFLTQAKARGYTVPDYAFAQGLTRLDNVVRNLTYDEWNLPVHAYALYVLATNRRTDVATLRYFWDTHGRKAPTALAKAQVAAALAMFGDKARGTKAFDAAKAHTSRPTMTGRYWDSFVRDYGSALRDRAGVLYLAAASQQGAAGLQTMIRDVSATKSRRQYLSTQEKAWLLLTAHVLTGKAPFKVTIDGEAQKARTKPLYRKVTDGELGGGYTVKNTGDDVVWHSVSISGIPKKDMPAEKKGFEVSRAFYTLDGKRVDLGKVKQSQVMVALIRVRATTSRNHQALIVDLLPAGFEIENPRLKGRSVKEMKWLPKLLEPRNVEPRDDRYVAAVDIGSSTRDFYLAYVVRAVTPGTFRLPAVHVEDMYAPSFFGRAAMGTVRIAGRS